MYSYRPPHMAEQKQDNQLEHIFSRYVRIWDVALKTCLGRWTIERSDERGSGISVLAARHDDDDIRKKFQHFLENLRVTLLRFISFNIFLFDKFFGSNLTIMLNNPTSRTFCKPNYIWLERNNYFRQIVH